MTVVEIIFLMLGGVNLFDSMIFSFGSAGTGGFSNYADSVAHFHSAYIDGVITTFCALFGVNFSLFYFMLLGDFKSVRKNEELRTYIMLIVGSNSVDHTEYPFDVPEYDQGVPLCNIPGRDGYHNNRICDNGFCKMADVLKINTYDADGRGSVCFFNRRWY